MHGINLLGLGFSLVGALFCQMVNTSPSGNIGEYLLGPIGCLALALGVVSYLLKTGKKKDERLRELEEKRIQDLKEELERERRKK